MGKPHEIELLGKTFRLKSGYDEQYLETLASSVNERIEQIRESGVLSSVDAALLAALNIADEYHRLKLEHERVLARVNEKSQKLLSWIDSQLQP